jgi:hypothetical protein
MKLKTVEKPNLGDIMRDVRKGVGSNSIKSDSSIKYITTKTFIKIKTMLSSTTLDDSFIEDSVDEEDVRVTSIFKNIQSVNIDSDLIDPVFKNINNKDKKLIPSLDIIKGDKFHIPEEMIESYKATDGLLLVDQQVQVKQQL